MVSDKLLPAIKSLIADLLAEVASDDTNTIADYLDLAKTSPIVGSALQVITQLAVLQLGEYTHPDEEIQQFMRMNFERMRGSLALSLEELMSVFPFGYAASQWGVDQAGGEYRLIDIQILNPADYSFEGKLGAIENVVVRGGTKDERIPYSGEDGRIIHVTNQRHLTFRDPFGVAALRRVMAAWKAWKIVIGEILVAAQRQATPILVGYSDSQITVPLLDAAGAPVLDAENNPVVIQAPTAMLAQLQSLDNRSVISTDITNRIEALQQQTNGTFLIELCRLLQQLQLMGLLFPESILTATGVGDSNLNTGHRSTLGLIINSLVGQIKEVILENPVRRLITWNKGDSVTDFGSFPEPESEETLEQRSALLAALTNAVQQGFMSAADQRLVDRGYELLGMEPPETPVKAMGRLFGGSLDYWKLEGNGNGATLDR
jgi:hypothetical protein